MKRIFVLAIVVLAIFGAVLPAFAQASVEKIDIDTPYGNPCTGEVIQLTGRINVVYNLVWDAASGGHLTYGMSYAINGVGPTNIRYNYVGSANENQNANFANGQNEIIIQEHVRLVSSGVNTSDLIFSYIAHFVVDANGNVRVYMSDGSLSCS